MENLENLIPREEMATDEEIEQFNREVLPELLKNDLDYVVQLDIEDYDDRPIITSDTPEEEIPDYLKHLKFDKDGKILKSSLPDY